jgi:hypothetical protein
MKSLAPTAGLVVLCLFPIACSSGPHVVSVKGTVTRGGLPLKNLLLTFYPEGDERPSSGQTDAEGRFDLKYDKDTKGASPGTHKVVVAFRPRSPVEPAFHPDQDAILEKYGKRETTALSVVITHAESDLQLKLD